jgi:hypothetical protein
MRLKAVRTPILITLCSCSSLIIPIPSSSLQQTKDLPAKNTSTQSILLKQDSPNLEEIANTPAQITGSKSPSKWVYSKDGAVGCRIKKWFSDGGKGQSVDFEFVNVKSKKPVNIVYRVNSIGEKGKVYRLLNYGSDNQIEYTRFISPLRKGESRIEEMRSKFPSYHATQAKNLLKLEMRDCRIKGKSENELTLKPEDVKYSKDSLVE